MIKQISNIQYILKQADARGLLSNISREQFLAYVSMQLPSEIKASDFLNDDAIEGNSRDTVENLLMQLIQGLIVKNSPFFIKSVLSGERFDGENSFGLCNGDLKLKLSTLVNLENFSLPLLDPISDVYGVDRHVVKESSDAFQIKFANSEYSVTPLLFALPDIGDSENTLHIMVPITKDMPQIVKDYQIMSAKIVASQTDYLKGYYSRKIIVRTLEIDDPIFNEASKSVQYKRSKFGVVLANAIYEITSSSLDKNPENHFRLSIDNVSDVRPFDDIELKNIEDAVVAISKGQSIHDINISYVGDKFHSIASSINTAVHEYADSMSSAIEELRIHCPTNEKELKVLIENIPATVIDQLYDKPLICAILTSSYGLDADNLVVKNTGTLLLLLADLSREKGDVFSPIIFLNDNSSKYNSMEIQ